MTLEQKLKDLILTRYKSVREFCQIADIPNTTLASIFSRGINNASIGNVIKLCKALNLSVDALADGKIEYTVYVRQPTKTIDVKDAINDFKSELLRADRLVLNGNPIDIEYVELIVDALDIGCEMVQKKHHKNHNKN